MNGEGKDPETNQVVVRNQMIFGLVSASFVEKQLCTSFPKSFQRSIVCANMKFLRNISKEN